MLGAKVSGDVAAAAVTGIQAAAVQHQINFTRDNEKEADRIGIVTLAKSGHDPYAMAGFFERLSKDSRTQENNAPEFLRTHPVNTNRIADAVARAEPYGHRQRPDSLRFHLTRADLRQRSFRRADQAVESFRKTLREGRFANETAEHYGLALALERQGDLEGAHEGGERPARQAPAAGGDRGPGGAPATPSRGSARGPGQSARGHRPGTHELAPATWPMPRP